MVVGVELNASESASGAANVPVIVLVVANGGWAVSFCATDRYGTEL